ncbi:MAG: hypothetical protein Q7S79_02275 [bacterium]|nr:hypothetical protein [bacterium]
MTEAGEFQTQTTATEAPAPKRNLFQKMIELFTRRSEASNAKPSEKFTREALLNYVQSSQQEPIATYESGSAGTVDLAKMDPGTIFRIQATSQNSYPQYEQRGEEEVVVTKPFEHFFWFIKGLEDDVFLIAGRFKGRVLKGPVAQEFLSNEDSNLQYVLTKTTPVPNLFKPEDSLKILLPNETVKSTNQEPLNDMAKEFEYLHDAYKAGNLDIMLSGKPPEDGLRTDDVDVLAHKPNSKPAQILSPA